MFTDVHRCSWIFSRCSLDIPSMVLRCSQDVHCSIMYSESSQDVLMISKGYFGGSGGSYGSNGSCGALHLVGLVGLVCRMGFVGLMSLIGWLGLEWRAI